MSALIWGRLRKYADEQEKRQQAEDLPRDADKPRVSFGEGCLMTLVAYAVLLVPAVAVLGGLALLAAWLIGAL